MHPCHVEVIALHRDRCDDVCDVRRACGAPACVRQLDPDEKLGHGHSCDRHVIVVRDQAFEGFAVPLGIDQ